jgi:hypothetical protein
MLPRDFWPPFRCGLTAGAFDPERTRGLENAEIALDLSVPGAPQPESYGMRAVYRASGWSVSAVDASGPIGSGPVAVGAGVLDFAFEHDGTTLVLLVRGRDAGPFREVASVAVGEEKAPFRQSVAVAGLGPGTEIGFDDYETVLTGESPVPLPADERCRELLFQAIELQLSAKAAVDALNTPGASAPLSDSMTCLNGALAAVEEMLAAPGKVASGPKKARRRIRQATKRVGKALTKVEKGKKAESVKKQILKALKLEAKALQAIWE